MEFALIKNGAVENIIVADQAFVDTLQGFDYKIDVTSLDPKPYPGVPYDGTTFNFPAPPAADPVPQEIQDRLDKIASLKQDKANGKTDNPSAVALKELLDDLIDTL